MINTKGKHKLNLIILMFQRRINGRDYIKNDFKELFAP